MRPSRPVSSALPRWRATCRLGALQPWIPRSHWPRSRRSVMRNLTNAVRQLTRRPGLPVVIVAILAIGIGVTTGIFSLFHQLLLEPLPVPEPDGLVNLAPTPIPSFSYPMFRDLEER